MSVSAALMLYEKTCLHPPTSASNHLSGDSWIFIGRDVNVTPEVDTPFPGMRHVEPPVVGP